jgi:uncharacterized protein (UPF0248 family)
MQPIHELLSRIRWDPSWAESDFEIGYYDRVNDRIIRVPYRSLSFPSDDHFDFELVDKNGELRTIPLHRVRSVYRDGELIWHRENW